MNRKTPKRILSAILILVMLSVTFSSCAKDVKSSDFTAGYSIEKDAAYLNEKGDNATDKLSGSDGAYIDISFRRPVDVNTVVIYEDGDNITDYEIFAMGTEGFTSIYKQDKVGSFRYCALGPIKTDCLRIKINKTKNNSFNISNIDVLNVAHTRDDFRITSYAVVDTIYNEASLDPLHFNVITDFILFGAVTFDEKGELHFNEYEIDGKKVDGKTALKTAIANVKSVAGNKVKLYVNLLGPNGDSNEKKEQLHTDLFNNNAEKLSEEIKKLIVELNVEGVYFDYEYPYTNKGWKAYSKFLTVLDEIIGEKKIGIAIGPWGGKLTNKAKASVDYIEVMAYDMFDEDNYHATFASNGGAFALDFANKSGYDMSKCDLGVPFYGRPLDRNAVWTAYNSCFERLGKYGNLDSATIEVGHNEGDKWVEGEFSLPRYYNSYQMIYDKTSFAYDYGAGGMMIWHYSCDAKADTGLSLFDAMATAIYDREK